MKLHDYLKIEGKGACSRLAMAIGVPRVLVSQWSLGVRQVPIERAIAIERETCGAVTVADLRPEFAESLRAAGYVRIQHQEQAA